MWRQIIRKAKDQKKPIIFVSDEKKEDWWWKAEGKTLGPRPELITEMMDEANSLFYMYRMDRFVNYAQRYLEIKVPQEVIDEVQEVAKERRSWKEEVINALVALGGDASLSEIYDYIESNTIRELPDTWEATVRYTLQLNSSDTKTHRRGGEDLFVRLERGYWGLKEYIDGEEKNEDTPNSNQDGNGDTTKSG